MLFRSRADDLGIVDVSKSNIKAYPNPVVDGKLIVELPMDAYSQGIEKQAILYNLVGQQLGMYTIIGTKTEIDISNMPAGIYLLKIGNGVVKIEKQ